MRSFYRLHMKQLQLWVEQNVWHIHNSIQLNIGLYLYLKNNNITIYSMVYFISHSVIKGRSYGCISRNLLNVWRFRKCWHKIYWSLIQNYIGLNLVFSVFHNHTFQKMVKKRNKKKESANVVLCLSALGNVSTAINHHIWSLCVHGAYCFAGFQQKEISLLIIHKTFFLQLQQDICSLHCQGEDSDCYRPRIQKICELLRIQITRSVNGSEGGSSVKNGYWNEAEECQ